MKTTQFVKILSLVLTVISISTFAEGPTNTVPKYYGSEIAFWSNALRNTNYDQFSLPQTTTLNLFLGTTVASEVPNEQITSLTLTLSNLNTPSPTRRDISVVLKQALYTKEWFIAVTHCSLICLSAIDSKATDLNIRAIHAGTAHPLDLMMCSEMSYNLAHLSNRKDWDAVNLLISKHPCLDFLKLSKVDRFALKKLMMDPPGLKLFKHGYLEDILMMLSEQGLKLDGPQEQRTKNMLAIAGAQNLNTTLSPSATQGTPKSLEVQIPENLSALEYIFWRNDILKHNANNKKPVVIEVDESAENSEKPFKAVNTP